MNHTPIKVVTAHCTDYDLSGVRAAVEAMLAPLGGMKAYVKQGQRVLLKPNLVMGFEAERAVNTHPLVVKAVGELVRECGGTIFLGDSPGIGSAIKVAKACGIAAVVAELGGEIIEFTAAPKDKGRTTGVDPNEGALLLGDLDMAQELAEMDVIINLPKFKSHGMTGLTLGVKNCFGMVVGTRKLRWHFRAGHNAELFSRMLVDVYRKGAPTLTIMDAVIGMEGEGPTAGTPRPLGFLAASTDCFALDYFCAGLVCADPRQIPTINVALKDDPEPSWVNHEVIGPGQEELKVSDFILPPPRTHFHMGPLPLFPLVRKWLTARPMLKEKGCIGCGVCKNICPAKAIEMVDGLPQIDDNLCIRCYCCHELCSEHAMTLKMGWLGRLFA